MRGLAIVYRFQHTGFARGTRRDVDELRTQYDGRDVELRALYFAQRDA